MINKLPTHPFPIQQQDECIMNDLCEITEKCTCCFKCPKYGECIKDDVYTCEDDSCPAYAGTQNESVSGVCIFCNKGLDSQDNRLLCNVCFEKFNPSRISVCK